MKLKGIPTRVRPVFFCPMCHTMYSEAEEATACLTSNEPAQHKVGDIVLISEGYTWFDGDPDWVVEGGGYLFNDEPTHAFLYVVTAVTWGDRRQAHWDMHHATYSLRTLAVKNGMPEGRHGWNRPRGHYKMLPPESVPQSVLDKVPEMIGPVYTNLL